MVFFISVGIDCGVAENLKKHNLRHFSLPFDWIVTYNGITDIIKNNFTNFFPDLSNSIFIDDIPNVFNDNYGIKFIHDKFPDENVYNKYIRRINRFKDILNNSNDFIVFIKKGHAHHNHNEYKIKDDIDDVLELDNLLKNKYPNLKYKIILTLLCNNCYKNKLININNDNIIINKCLINTISSNEFENKMITKNVYDNIFIDQIKSFLNI